MIRHHNKRKMLFRTCIFLAAALGAQGCGSGGGGGGGGSAGTPLQGDAAFRAVALGGFQSLGAGSAYPYNALTLTSPTGSSINSRAARAMLAALRPGLQISRVPADRSSGLTFYPIENLYGSGPILSGNTVTINFYTDSAGTQSAGSMVMTLPQSASSSSFFNSYPAAVQVAVNVTAGTLPCKGNATITFSGPTGANTMVGSLTLTNNNVEIDIDATLTDTLNVTGTLTVKENGATITMTNVSGAVLGPLTSNVTVAPYGWTGTATINLTTGSLTVQLNTGTGTSKASSDASGNVTLNFADGASATVSNAYTASLTSSGSGTGTGTGTGSAKYSAPISLGNSYPMSINSNGGIAAGGGTSNTGPSFYLSTPTAAPQYLAPFNGQTPYDLALDKSGEILGYNSSIGFVYYTTASSAPVSVQGGQLFLNSSGGVSGYLNNYAFYQSSLTGTQVQLLPLAGAVSMVSNACSPNGQVIGLAFPANGSIPVCWPKADTTTLPVQLKTLSGWSGTWPTFINNAGQIVGTTQIGGAIQIVYWKSPTDQSPTVLPQVSGSNNNTLSGMNASGVIVGSSGNKAVMWLNGTMTDLNTVIPSGGSWVLTAATAINDNGWIAGEMQQNGTAGAVTYAAFLIKPGN